jgi:hypothetical protein
MDGFPAGGWGVVWIQKVALYFYFQVRETKSKMASAANQPRVEISSDSRLTALDGFPK